ncbi:MAG: helix-turn-helix transcriptional regulator [Oscillospiraceae bacterium]|nr:helix-turn-helix transcriptional regulator [Oscillospiraceae bacterium]
MNLVNSQIVKLIDSLQIKKGEFAESLQISQAFVSQICSGVRQPSDRTISDICRIYNVRRQWLEEGKGPMRQPETEDDEIVDAVLAGEDEFVKAVIRGIAKTPGGWEKMREVFLAIQAELDKQK